MPVDVGGAIAERALSLVGTPFRFRGRNPDVGLDCIGVVAQSLSARGASFDVPGDYALRGEYAERIAAFFDRDCFAAIRPGEACCGDILSCRPADRQVHFAVSTAHGLVHAHAGLRRVALTPFPVPWPIDALWRFTGD